MVVTGRASLVGDRAEVARYRQVLSPWVAGEMDQVIRIRAEIVTGFRLDARPGAGAGLGA